MANYQNLCTHLHEIDCSEIEWDLQLCFQVLETFIRFFVTYFVCYVLPKRDQQTNITQYFQEIPTGGIH